MNNSFASWNPQDNSSEHGLVAWHTDGYITVRGQPAGSWLNVRREDLQDFHVALDCAALEGVLANPPTPQIANYAGRVLEGFAKLDVNHHHRIRLRQLAISHANGDATLKWAVNRVHVWASSIVRALGEPQQTKDKNRTYVYLSHLLLKFAIEENEDS